MPRTININEIEEGMVLSEPVINSYRQTLIKAGAKLKSSNISLLKTWNILKVRIKAEEDEDVSELGLELQKLSKERLEKRMKWKPRNENEKALYELGILRAASIITKNY